MKEKVSWTIDEDIVAYLENEAKEQDRSVSYLANEILKRGIELKGGKRINSNG